MVEGAARDRIKRALHTRAQVPGEAMELCAGDLVGWFYRPLASQGVPGWKKGQRQLLLVLASDMAQLTTDATNKQHIVVRGQQLRLANKSMI